MGVRYGQFEYDEYEPTAGTLRGEGFEAFFGATGYANDDHELVKGEVWVVLSGTARFEAAVPATWWAEALEDSQKAFAKLNATLSGEAVIAGLGNVELRVKLEYGRGTISGRVQDEVGARLEFDGIPTDQTYLGDAVAGLERIVEVFPAPGRSRGHDR